jgi:hypothetical protein
MFLHHDNPRILVALRVVARQTFPGILSWGAWISIPAYSSQIVLLLDLFYLTDYNGRKQQKQRQMA